MNINYFSKSSAFTLVELVIVIAIVGVLVAVTVVLFKPAEVLANGRNAKRLGDINALNQAVGQWLSREGADQINPYDILGLLDPGVTAITTSDGDISTEGVDATTVSTLNLPAYIQIIPMDPDGSTEYRIGVDDLGNPMHVLVCTGQMEVTPAYPDSLYPNGIFCQSN